MWTSKRYDFAKGTVETRQHEQVTPISTPLMEHLSRQMAAKSKELREDMWAEFRKRYGGTTHG